MNAWDSLPIPIEAQRFALHVALGGMCVSGMVLGVAALMRRRSEPMRYGILLAGVIGLLAVPALVGLGRACQETLPWFAAGVDDEVVKVPAEMLPELLNRPVADPVTAAESPSLVGEMLVAALLAFWALGTSIGMGRLLHGLWRQRRLPAGSLWRAAFWTDDRKAQLAQKLDLRRFPPVHLSPAVPMPMVIGLWRPTIVLPERAPAMWEQPQWEAVLLHEAAHIARGDHWAALAQRVAVICYWWCPPVHLLTRRLNELRENICDDCALQGTCDRIAYAEVLVESAEHFLNLTALPVQLGLLDSARGGLEARVTRLLEKERPMMTSLSLPGKLLGAAFLMAACLLTTAGTAFSGGQPQPEKRIQIKILLDGKELDLDNAKLLEHIEALQKKAAGDAQNKTFKAVFGISPDDGRSGNITFKPDQPDGPSGAGKQTVKPAIIGADGKFIVIGSDKTYRIWDAKSGEVQIQGDPFKPKAQPAVQAPIRFTQVKPDPRIEELVKQAEAIKPGSGAEIRKALEAAPKYGDVPSKSPMSVKPNPQMSGVTWWSADAAKKVILLAIEDGKVLQLSEADLRRLIEQGVRFRLDTEVSKQKAAEKDRAVDWIYKAHKESAGDKKPIPTPPPADLEALSRQLDRLNAELNDLRKRLEGGKRQ